MSATSHRRPTTEILDALETALRAVQWSGEFAFARIARFSRNELREAFAELLISEKSIALIVPDAEQFVCETRGRTLEVCRTLPVMLVFSDCIIGNEETAIYGDVNNAGAFGLLEAALPAVTGQLLANPHGVQVEPRTATIFKIAAGDLPGRGAVMLEIECTGGYLEATLGPGPNY